MSPNPTDLAERVAAQDVRALSRALTWVESRAPGADELLAQLFDRRRGAWRIGVTGAPGSGKSTLVDAIIGELRQAGKRVAVLAIDPSSPFTGGAILADRVRMLAHAADSGVYVRSMASRGSLGGLAPTAADALTVLETAHFDVILIETLGVGQAEVDVAGLAEQVALVLTPGSGDDMQAMKAGVMEIADILVLNKADQSGIDALERHLQALPGTPPIVRTTASQAAGVPELLAALHALPHDPAATQHYWRRRLTDALIRGIAEKRLPQLASTGEIEAAAEAITSGKQNPYKWLAHILDEPFAHNSRTRQA